MGRKRYKVPNNIYVVGSNAAKLNSYEAAPPRIDEEQQVTRQRQRRVVKRKRKNYLYTTTFSLAVLSTLFACVILLKAQFTVNGIASKVDELQSSLRELQNKNSQIEASINKSVNFEEVYRVATEELGMVMPSSAQVQYIDKDNVSFTSQYADVNIEEEKETSTNVLGFIGW